jgi:hypothetical protein
VDARWPDLDLRLLMDLLLDRELLLLERLPEEITSYRRSRSRSDNSRSRSRSMDKKPQVEIQKERREKTFVKISTIRFSFLLKADCMLMLWKTVLNIANSLSFKNGCLGLRV